MFAGTNYVKVRKDGSFLTVIEFIGLFSVFTPSPDLACFSGLTVFILLRRYPVTCRSLLWKECPGDGGHGTPAWNKRRPLGRAFKTPHCLPSL